MSIDWKTAGLRCREAREYLGYTQEQVARHAGMHRPSYSMIEAGERTISVAELDTLSNLFHRSPEWLTGREARIYNLPDGFSEKVEGLPEEDIHELGKFAEFLRFKRAKG